MTPVGTVRRSKTVRIGYIISVLLAIAVILAVWPHPAAAALSVNLPNLPVVNQKTVEKVLPVNVQVKANLSVTLPPVVGTTPAHRVINNLTVPVPPPVSSVVQTAAETIPVVASPPTVTLSTASTTASTPSNSAKKSTIQVSNKHISKPRQSEEPPLVVAPVPFGGADFLNVAFTSALQNSADHMSYRKVDGTSVIANAGVFLLSLTIIMGVIYAMLRKNIIPVGNGVLSQLVTYPSTRTQILLLVVVVLVAELLGISLVLSLQEPTALWQNF